MFRSWEEHQLGTPLHFLLQTMTNGLRLLDEQEVIANNYTAHHYICDYEVDRLLIQLEKQVYR